MDDKKEIIWKDIPGYEGLYKVSNTGKVYSVINNKILIPNIKNGYERICLYKENIPSYLLVHRLVAFAFIPNPDPIKYTIINHKDENGLNNNVENLEWCDYHYNNTYGTVLERRKETVIKTWKNKSDEEKLAYSKSQSEKTKEVWNNKTEEEKKQWGIDIKERWQGYSDEYKQKFSEKMSQVNKENWENKTEESKEEFKNIMKDVWKNKTDEQREAYRKIQSKLNRERFDNMSEEDKEKMRIQARQNGFICAFMCQLKLNEKLFLSPTDVTDKNIITDDECGIFVLPNMYITQYFDKDRNKPIFHSGSLM